MTARYNGDAFVGRFGPWAVIAGGSDGIGAAFAKDAARRGLNVALIARRKEPLERMATEIQDRFGVETRTISSDLTAPDVAEAIAAQTGDLDVGLFVYNAGSNRKFEHFVDLEIEDLELMLDLACRGPLLLSKLFAGRQKERGRGGIVLMSSMACLAGCAYNTVYSASKAFDAILAEGLWIELAPFGVDVLGVLAGSTRTETVLAGSDQFEDAMDPADVARGALDHLGKGPNWVPGEANQAGAKGMWPAPRVALINGMSQATSSLYHLEHTVVEGLEFHED